MGHFMVISMKIYPAEYSLSFTFLILYIVNSLVKQLDFRLRMLSPLYASFSFRKFSHFLSIPEHFIILISPNICHWFWFYLRDGFFCEMHAFNLGLQLTLSFIQRTCHPRDVSYKGRVIQGSGTHRCGILLPLSSSFQAPYSSFCLFLLPSAPSRPF